MSVQVTRHAAQLAAVLPYLKLEDLPDSVQRQVAAAVNSTIPVVAVLYYGGTVGMVMDEQGHLVPCDDAERLLKPLKLKGLDQMVRVIWIPVYKNAIDSTNGRWIHWVTMGNAIRLLYDLVDGFVLCGGTDTMAHLMAAMNFMFPNIGKPIIGAGAQIPMIKPGSDAEANLFRSIYAAISNLRGAHLAFADVLISGLAIFKVQDTRLMAFEAKSSWQYIGHFTDDVVLYPNAPARVSITKQSDLIFRPNFREGVKVVPISPATPSESILHDAKDPNCSVLLLITFGAGNVRDEGVIEGELTHLDCIRRLHKEGYPVVLGSPMKDGCVASPYRTGALAVMSPDQGGAGAISAGDTTGPTLEVKCMVALALAWDEEKGEVDYIRFVEIMTSNMVGELTVNLKS